MATALNHSPLPQAFEGVDPALALAHHNLSWRNPAEYTLVLTGGLR